MRSISGPIWDRWASGLYVGDAKPQTRVTVEIGWTLQTSTGAVGTRESAKCPVRYVQSTETPPVETEIPNIKSVETSDSVDTDAATCTITIYNQSMLPVQTDELGNPGYFTFSRGASGNPWSHTANDWSDVIVPNALIRSYSGFGADGKTIAQALDDGDIIISGTWLVDDVQVTTDGMIKLKCRSLAKLLIEQMVYPPLIPPGPYPIGFYPVQYARFFSRDTTGAGVPYGTAVGGTRRIVGIQVGPPFVDATGATDYGYWLVGTDGGVFTYGAVFFYGSLAGNLTDVMGIAQSVTGRGYLLGSQSGGIAAFGDATDLGSPGARPTAFVAIESMWNAEGYIFVDADGEVYSYGNAPYNGNASVAHPAVAAAISNDDAGYYILDDHGEIYALGATYHGNASITANKLATGIATSPTDDGYWVVDSTGAVFALGSVPYHGGANNLALNDPISDIVAAPDGDGYWLVGEDGGVFAYGSAQFYGSLVGASSSSFPLDGNFRDISDIIKDLALWSGFWLHPNIGTNGEPTVHGNIEYPGSYPSNPIPEDFFDKNPVINPMTKLKETVGFWLHVEEDGALSFVSPNFFDPGNFLPDGSHTTTIPVIDESVNLITYGVDYNDTAARSEVIISSEEPTLNLDGTLTASSIPPTSGTLRGLVKTAMWINTLFDRQEDLDYMIELLNIQLYFQQRLGSLECVLNPAICVGDQIKIKERQTEDFFIHFVRSKDTTHDLDTGSFSMRLTTHWLASYDGVTWSSPITRPLVSFTRFQEEHLYEVETLISYISPSRGLADSLPLVDTATRSGVPYARLVAESEPESDTATTHLVFAGRGVNDSEPGADSVASHASLSRALTDKLRASA